MKCFAAHPLVLQQPCSRWRDRFDIGNLCFGDQLRITSNRACTLHVGTREVSVCAGGQMVLLAA